MKSEDAQHLFETLKAQGVPVARMPDYLKKSSQEARARAAEPIPATNRAADIVAVIGAAREMLSRLDIVGATALLYFMIAEETP